MTSAWQGRLGLFGSWLAALLVGVGLTGCEDDPAGDVDGGVEQGTPVDTGVDQAALDTGVLDQGSSCPVGAPVVISEDISEDTTWSCPSYRLSGRIFVVGDSTLTIAPGTQILGNTSFAETAALVVTRGSELVAVGTAELPIVFTSGHAEGSRTPGDWIGVNLLGNATINSGTDNGGVLEGRLEGFGIDGRTLYGGSQDTSRCGHLEYVRIEFAGYGFDTAQGGLTLAGCGSGTRLSHVQVHRSIDDGVATYGGTASMDHVVISGASNDSLDWDYGWRGDAQFLVIHQFDGLGDAGIEADNLGSHEAATPRSHPRMFNVTMVGTSASRGMVLREGTRGLLRNFIVTGFGGESVDLRATTNDLTAEWPTQLSIENSFFSNNGAYHDEVTNPLDNDDNGFDEQAAIEDAARSNTTGTDPMIGSTSATAPSYVPANTALNGQATPPAGFDTSATYAGAFAPNGTDWTAGWTAFPEN
jgi:hypothetical protein